MLIESYQKRIQRREDKTQVILSFLRDEIWSTSTILGKLLGFSRTGIYKTLAYLEKNELVRSHHYPELNQKLYGITPKGLMFSWEEHEAFQDRAYFEPSKVKPLMVQHYVDTQQARLQANDACWKDWLPGHLLQKGLAKRPDAVAISPQGLRIAVEIERTVKTKKRYEVIWATYLQAVKRNEFDYVHYVCPDANFAQRLRRMFSIIDSVPIAGQRVPIAQKHRARFPTFSLSQWPPLS